MKVSDIYHNGVTEFTRATYKVTVNFPYDNVCCRLCEKLSKKDTGQFYCRLSYEILIDSMLAQGVGDKCPLEIEEYEVRNI